MIESLESRIAPATLVALDDQNNLLRFESDSPQTIDQSIALTGLPAGETIVGIDYRPADQKLYGFSNLDRLYRINLNTGAANFVANLDIGVTGSTFGVDFNPVGDRLRVVSDTDGNYRINADSGANTIDTPLAYAAGDVNAGQNPTVVASAYTNPDNDLDTATALYGIDTGLNILVSQSPPNSGALQTIGALGVDVTSVAGFDIARDNTAFAALTSSSGTTALYEINLDTGAATGVGTIGTGLNLVRNIAVIPSGFSSTVFDDSAVFTGLAGGDLLQLTANGGLLRHNRFAEGDPGFESPQDFDSEVPGVQTLSSTTGLSSITVNAGAGDDVLRIGGASSSAQEVDALITFNGGTGDDQLIFDNSADTGARTIRIDKDQVVIPSVGASSVLNEVERIDVTTGSGPATVNVESTAPNVATSVNAFGSSSVTINIADAASTADLPGRLQGSLNLTGSQVAGASAILADDADATGNRGYAVTDTSLRRDGTIIFSHTGFDRFTLVAGSGNDIIVATEFAGYAIVDGGPGLDQISGAEARISEQSLVYRDVDNDRVTLTTNIGGFTLDDFELAFPSGGVGAQLRLIDLSDDGTEFQGASLTLSVKQRGSGDGLGEVGYINATNVDLGTVKLRGDLGQIDAGDAVTPTAGLGKLNVASLGELGLASQGLTGDLRSDIKGNVGLLRVRGDVQTANVVVDGAISQINIDGSLVGGVGASSGSIRATGDIGLARIGGSFLAGSTAESGSLIGANLASVLVEGSLIAVASSAADSASIISNGTIGKVKVLGSLLGGPGNYSATVFAAGNIGNIDAAGLPTGGVRIEGSIVGRSGDTGIVSSTGSISKIKVLGDVFGGTSSPVKFTALGRTQPATEAEALAIGLIDIRGVVANAEILAGYNDANDLAAVNGDAQIGAVLVGRDLIASDIVAGALAGIDGKFGTGDDTAATGFSATIESRIARIQIGGQVTGSSDTDDHFGFVAERISQVIIDGEVIPLTPGAHNDVNGPALSIAPTGDVRVREV